MGLEQLLAVRSDLQVVLDGDGLAVQHEGVRRVFIEHGEQLLHEPHEHVPALFPGHVPFPVPVGVRDEEGPHKPLNSLNAIVYQLTLAQFQRIGKACAAQYRP